MFVFLGLLLLAASGCDQYGRDGRGGTGGRDEGAGGGDGDGPSWVDSDGDGLSDSEEDDLGTDPDDVDSDGDGWEDEDEVDASTDPLDAGDHPYEQGWPIDSCRNDISPTGNQIGQITDNFELLSQTGEMVRLHDFCGRAVFMITAAFW
jgi:hypothetical protein